MAGPQDITGRHGSSGSRPDLSGAQLSPFQESVNSVNCRLDLGEDWDHELINNSKDLDELFRNIIDVRTSMIVDNGKPEDNDQRPQIGMMFPSLEEAEEFYRNHAKRTGFTVRKGKVHKLPDGALKWRRFLCSCQGLRAKKQSDGGGTKYQKLETRTGCLAHIQFTLENEEYKITHLELEHNHPMNNSNSNGSPGKSIKEAPLTGSTADPPLKRSRLQAILEHSRRTNGETNFDPGEEVGDRSEEDLTDALRLLNRLLKGNHKEQLLEEVTKLDSIRQQLHTAEHQGFQLLQQTQEDSASSYSEQSMTKASTDVQNPSYQLTMEEQPLLISNTPAIIDATQVVPPTKDVSQFPTTSTPAAGSSTPYLLCPQYMRSMSGMNNWRGPRNAIVQAEVSTSSVSRGNESAIWQQILSKYGDITAKISVTSPTFVAFVKQSILEIVELLQNNTVRGLSHEGLSAIGRTLGDLELLQVDVGWLRARYVAVEHIVDYAKAKDNRDEILRRLHAKSAEVAELQLDLDLAEAHLQELQHRLPPWHMIEEKLGKGLL